jgi:hypothetical protein
MRAGMAVLGVALMLPLARATSGAQASPPKLDTMKVVEPRKEAPRGGRNLLTAEDLLSKNYNNLYEALDALRPFWLRARGPSRLDMSGQGPSVRVYLDEVRLGAVDELKLMSIRTIRRVTFLSAPEAQARYGVGNESGALVIETLGDEKAP